MAEATVPAQARDVLSVAEIMPVRYQLELTPDLERFVFGGSVAIEVDVRVAGAMEVTVNAKELCVSTASFAGSDGKILSCIGINQDLVASRMTFVFASAMPKGAGTLHVVFTGELNNQMAGFYRSSYSTVEGQKRLMASTQFEAIDARRCFPCWDEPNRKAVFGVTLIIDQHLTALSNMPEKEVTTLAGGKKKVVFLDSPVMSTYLLAFVIGEFDFVQATSKHGVTIRTFTPPGKSRPQPPQTYTYVYNYSQPHIHTQRTHVQAHVSARVPCTPGPWCAVDPCPGHAPLSCFTCTAGKEGKFALDCAVGSLDLYDEFFGLEYPLVKLDMIAIPEFAAGAMENWYAGNPPA